MKRKDIKNISYVDRWEIEIKDLSITINRDNNGYKLALMSNDIDKTLYLENYKQVWKELSKISKWKEKEAKQC